MITIKYMGSKSKIAKHIVPIIQSYIKDGTVYIEPFVGGANVIDKINADKRYGYDINKYVIALLNYIKTGNTLPQDINRAEYSNVRANKNNYPDWYVGFIGICGSYNGRFFDGGYSGTVKTKAGERNYCNEAIRNIVSQAKNLKGINFAEGDYKTLDFTDAVIYCDPPYHGTKEYLSAKNFHSNEFWEWVRKQSKKNIVIVSEQKAPSDFTAIWEQAINRTIDNASTVKAVEKLFVMS